MSAAHPDQLSNMQFWSILLQQIRTKLALSTTGIQSLWHSKDWFEQPNPIVDPDWSQCLQHSIKQDPVEFSRTTISSMYGIPRVRSPVDICCISRFLLQPSCQCPCGVISQPNLLPVWLLTSRSSDRMSQWSLIYYFILLPLEIIWPIYPTTVN